MKINNLTCSVGDGVLEKPIEFTPEITLDYQQNQLSFEFAAMDFSSPRMNQFRYRLLGVENDLVASTTARSATYAHLAPGSYVFEVTTGGTRGIWNGKPAQLHIRILLPWWRSGWACTLYLLLFTGGAWALYRFQANKIRLENKLAFEQNEALQLAELDRLKTNFFSSVTHEFRTHLTLLLEPARHLLSEAKDQFQLYRLELIEKNARRSVQLNVEIHDTATVLYDALKWEQVASNLLSNALKFTKEGGTVHLKLTEENVGDSSGKTQFKLKVSDNGIGIPTDELPQVFDRFFQAEHSMGGTGIGLSLTRELVERMGGNISVKSVVGAGTTFIVQLPFETKSAELLSAGHEAVSTAHTFLKPILQKPTAVDSLNPGTELSPLLLLVEDDTDLRRFINASLPAGYRIVEAGNGTEGIQIALELMPDLVICDLAMPLKDGFEVVETLKIKPGTSHVPIILLTAKSSLESKIEGLSRGADAYPTKPFRADELVAHVENLLESQKRLQTHFSKHQMAEGLPDALPAQELEFLQRLIQLIEENLESESMDADAFAHGVFISRSQLHRKVTALTGLSLTEFVCNYRLDRARDMFMQRAGSISEIAWETGFQNAKYFSTCFKERFGETPSGFISGK